MRRALLVVCWISATSGCTGPTGDPIEVVVPRGVGLTTIADTLNARGIIEWPALFRVYARLRGDDQRIKSGTYALTTGERWSDLLDILVAGRVVTVPVTLPEGLRLPEIAERVASVNGVPADSVLKVLNTPGADSALGVPGPGLEGYLFPDTYRFARGVPVREVVEAMARRYRETWTSDRRARLDSLGMTERELITLASIVQAEARVVEEMPRIASVYHNRLALGWLLQADPTVLYALGGHRERLLFAAMDSVADHPYNTYTQTGLPPGPIGAPGEAAIDAALFPSNEPFLYFVARGDGSHVFSRTLAEHNRAVAEARRQRAQTRSDEPG